MTSIYNYVIVLTIGGLAFGFNGRAESQENTAT